MNNLDAVYTFIQNVASQPLDENIARHAKRCFADTLAVMVGGKHNELSRIS